MTRSALFVSFTLLLSACTTPGTYVEPDGPPESVAVVRGMEPGFLEAVNPLGVLGTDRTVKLATVDGETLTSSGWSGLPIEVRVAPGKRTIGVEGKVELDRTIVVREESEISHHFFAGKTYQITVDLLTSGTLVFGVDEVREE